MIVFSAIQLNETTSAAAMSLQELLRERTVGSFPRAENLHITMHYFGEVSRETLDRIIHVTSSVPCEKTQLTLDHLTVFPSNKGDHIVLAGTPSMEIQAYHEALSKQYEAEGIFFDRKKFLPHVTLVRAKTTGVDLSELRCNEVIQPVKWIGLYSSEQVKGQRVYTELWGYEPGGNRNDDQSSNI